MADPVATVQRQSKAYIHQSPLAGAALLAATFAPFSTKVGEQYVATDGVIKVVSAVNATTGVPTLVTVTTS